MAKSVKKSTVYILEGYILLVYYGYKDAYLVDCCMLSEVEAVSLLRSMQSKYTLNTDVLKIILVQEDIFIVNSSNIKFHLNKLTRGIMRDENDYSPSEGMEVIVQPHKANNAVIGYQESILIFIELKTLLETFTDVGEGIVSKIPVCPTELVSCPLLAGWLLGYPCIYQSQGSTLEHSSNSSLSMQELCKICFKVDLSMRLNATADQLWEHKDLELIGFSIPQQILQENDQIRLYLDNKIVHLQEQLNSRSSTNHPIGYPTIRLSNIRLERITITVPSIVL